MWSVSKPTPTGVHTGTATIAGPTNSTPVVVTFTSTMIRPNGSAQRAPENFTVSTDPDVGDLGDNEYALNVAHSVGIVADRATYRQEVRISFDRPVTGLSFTITDIDTQFSDADLTWSDRVELSPDLTSFAFPAGSEVIGRGRNEGTGSTTIGPFRRTDNLNVDNTGDNSGNVNVSYSSRPATTPFLLSFWTNNAAGDQRIFLSDFEFTASTCK